MGDVMASLHADITKRLNQIGELFDEEHMPMITLVIRTPWIENGGVLMGNDDLDAAIAEINRLRVSGKETTPP